jgi:hypothetical protein
MEPEDQSKEQKKIGEKENQDSSAQPLSLTSPIKIEIDAILEEFKILKSEIRDRFQIGQQITNLSITFSIGIVGFLQFLQKDNTLFTVNSKEIIIYTYLIGSVISSCFGLMYLGQDVTIGHLATYINQKLRPKLETIMLQSSGQQHSIWEWDDFRSQQQFRSPMSFLGLLINSPRYLLTILPSIILFFTYFASRDSFKAYSILEIIFIILATLISISSFILIIYVALVYRGISQNSEKLNVQNKSEIV